MIREYDKFTYIYTKYKNQLINNTMKNKYLDNLFDYYLRYLNFYPDINNLNYNEADIKINPKLENSFKTFIQKRDALVKNKISLSNSAPYYKEFMRPDMNPDKDEAFMNEEFKVLKNTYIDYELFYNNKNSIYYEPEFKQDETTGEIKIKDVWEF